MAEQDGGVLVEGAALVVFVTAPRGRGEEIAAKLLEARVAACVNIVQARSLYWWQGSIERDDEDLLVIKTTMDRFNSLVELVKKIHPYQVPEILALPVAACLGSYCSWLREETRG